VYKSKPVAGTALPPNVRLLKITPVYEPCVCEGFTQAIKVAADKATSLFVVVAITFGPNVKLAGFVENIGLPTKVALLF
jgi:hypothetical protein